MPTAERAFTFACDGDWLVGHLSLPPVLPKRGVLIVVGGPQYRAGSHRQFTLLARHLAERGIPAMRFDCRGMGDSTGDARTFEDIGRDVRAAADAYRSATGVEEVVIWALCDAASAAAFYAHRDPRIAGLVLVNPWVRTPHGVAVTTLRHYYLKRIFDPAAWRRFVVGEARLAGTMKSVAQALHIALVPAKKREGTVPPLPERMAEGLERFRGPILLVLSGNDLTAKEFIELTSGSQRWRALLGETRVSRRELPEANHTFSKRAWRDEVAAWTTDWIASW